MYIHKYTKKDFNKQIEIYKHSFIPTFVRETEKCIMYVCTFTLKRKQDFLYCSYQYKYSYVPNKLTKK